MMILRYATKSENELRIFGEAIGGGLFGGLAWLVLVWRMRDIIHKRYVCGDDCYEYVYIYIYINN